MCFLLNVFYNNKKDTVKSNNKKNNYINQIIKITVAKTHTHRKKIIQKKGGSTNLPP